MSKRLKKRAGILAVAFFYIVSPASARLFAQTLESSNYRFEEGSLTGGGLLESSSGSYQIRDALGNIGIGNSESTNFQTDAGSHTSPDPALSVRITESSPTLGEFSPTVTAVATSTFEVSNYTSYGYAVHIVGEAPANSTHTIPALATTSTPQTGVEEFGINLVANTAPTSFGANPDQGQFGEGVASANYSTPNQFRYVSGEQIASAPESSGITVYTISYIVNVANLTPGGQYRSNQTLVVTGTY